MKSKEEDEEEEEEPRPVRELRVTEPRRDLPVPEADASHPSPSGPVSTEEKVGTNLGGTAVYTRSKPRMRFRCRQFLVPSLAHR